MMEYTISGFTPVILAAAGATALSRLVYGAGPALSVPALDLASLGEPPLVLLVGLVAGTLAAGFNRSLVLIGGLLPDLGVGARAALGGLAAGLIGMPVPEVMGLGYDTVGSVLSGQGAPGPLAAIALAKLAATALALGLGLPGALIGPTPGDRGHRRGRRLPGGGGPRPGSGIGVRALRLARHGGQDGGYPPGPSGGL